MNLKLWERINNVLWIVAVVLIILVNSGFKKFKYVGVTVCVVIALSISIRAIVSRAKLRDMIISLLKAAVIFIFGLLLLQAKIWSRSYDANGNLVTGDGKFRVYNSLNQLVQLYNGTNTSGVLLQEYSYHPAEERILVKKN